MKETKYGKVSRVTLGTVQLGGGAYGINNAVGALSKGAAAEILEEALALGIRSFDTARGYGESEAVLGDFFRTHEAEKTIITKVAFREETPAEIKASLFSMTRNSCTRLGLETIPLLLLHSEVYLERYGKTLSDALLDLKKAGLVKSVGISFSDKTRLMELTDPAVFDAVQIPVNMFDSREAREGQMRALADRDIDIYVRSVYLQGLFFKDPETLPPKLLSAKAPLLKLRALGEELGISMAEMAMAYAANLEGCASLVIGCETRAQLLETVNLAAAPPLSAEITGKIHEIAEEIEPVVIRPWEWNS